MSQPASVIDVPILGQQFKPHVGYVMASLTCLCQPDNPPLVIRGVDLVEVCPHCLNIYGIMHAEYDYTAGQLPRVMVGIRGKAERRTQPNGDALRN